MNKTILNMLLAVVTVIAFCPVALSQHITVPKDIQGRRLMVKEHAALKGSPYLYDTWKKGTVTLMNGSEFRGQIMYDQLDDKVVFDGGDGEPREFIDHVYEFTIQTEESNKSSDEKRFRRGYPAVDDGSKSTFYEILTEGNTSLLKRTKKTIVEQVPYGSSVKEQHIKAVETYFIATPTNLIKVKSTKKSFLEAFADKSSQLDAFAKKNKLNFNNEADLIKLVSYYNSL